MPRTTCAAALPMRRAATPLPAAGPQPPGSHASRQGSERRCGAGACAGGSHPPQFPSQDYKTALDFAKEKKRTEVVRVLEKYDPGYLAAQVGRAAPAPAPQPQPQLISPSRSIRPYAKAKPR